jgi:hypothetical protein
MNIDSVAIGEDEDYVWQPVKQTLWEETGRFHANEPIDYYRL